MAIDGIILSKVKDELQRQLPMRINRITQISSDDILLNVHANKERKNLIISTHSLYNRVHFTKKDYNNTSEPGAFVMGLRKYINNGIIEKIEQINYDRYLIFYIRALDDLYDTKHYRLHIELMGKYANVILVDEDNKIIDALKRIPPFENTKRTIWPGAKFEYPENQEKKDPYTATSIDFGASLVAQLMGFSPLLQKEVNYRLENRESWDDIIKEIKESKTIYVSKDDLQYHIIPLKHIASDFKSFNIDEGFDYLYFALEEKIRIKEITGDLFKFTQRQIKHYRQKILKIAESIESAKGASDLKDCGDILYTAEDLNKKGLSEIKLQDFNGNEVTIKLDPKLSIKDNANKYYNNYQKKKRSTKYLLEQKEIAEAELDYFNSIDEQLTLANFYDAQMIKEELVKYGYLKSTNKRQAKHKKDKYGIYQIKYKDYLITFGKNHSQNEIVTFKYAKSNYLWFHAQSYHGAHLCINNDSPDEEVIRLCANLAAFFSSGRYSSSVPVDYCLVKNVKKIKGSKAGKVAISNYKTIFIDPEEVDLDIHTI